MSGNVITHFDQVTLAWLTEVLSNSGAQSEGMVESFEVVQDRGNWSTSGRLKVRYSQDSQGMLPRNLFLKMVNTDLDDEFFGPSEVYYYTRDYVDVEHAPLIHCYDGAYSEPQQRYHLLLDDLIETHVRAADRAPTLAYGLALAEGLAVLHARWWGGERLAQAGASVHTPEQIRHFVEIAEPGAGHILEQFSDWLEPHWPDMLRASYAKHPPARGHA